MEITIKDIFDKDGPIKELKDDYTPRESQIKSAELIEGTVKNNEICILEGPCGMGKSFAYLTPIIKDIADNEFSKTALIVTAGISLQEQLIEKDIPFVVSVMKNIYPNWSSDFSYTLLKGRQNFICQNKINELGGFDKFTSRAMFKEDFLEVFKLANGKTGDISELKFVPDSDMMSQISCTEQGECLGKDCEFGNSCFYNNHKKKLLSSNIIVTNYHMLFSDCKCGGFILPNYDILVFDEAHEATNIFRDFNELKISENTPSYIRKKVTELYNLNAAIKNIIDEKSVSNLITSSQLFFSEIKRTNDDIESSPKLIGDISEIPSSVSELFDSLCAIENKCERVYANYFSESGEFNNESDKKICAISSTLCQTCFELATFIKDLASHINDENSVIWISSQNNIYSLNFKPVDIGAKINKALFSDINRSVVFTSATISVSGQFDYFKNQLGLDLNKKKINELIGSSPFNLEEQQLWYLPNNALDGNKFGFDDEIVNHMIDIINQTNGGVLGLFTSVKNMNKVTRALRDAFPFKKILKQGDMPRTALVNEFREDGNAILIGTKSLFTGIDVPGNALRCVVIDKLPFPQVNDPVQQKIRNRPNAFYKYSIPDMIISLKQAVGRGVRSIDDKCVICIIDGRMATAKYKFKINNSFPYKKKGTRNIEDIGKFLQ